MAEELVFNWLDENGERNDETCVVTLAGAHIITMDHGEHGWDGMVGIRDALTAVARHQGWTVRLVGKWGI